MGQQDVRNDARGNRHQQELTIIATYVMIAIRWLAQMVHTPVVDHIATVAILDRYIAAPLVPTLMPATVVAYVITTMVVIAAMIIAAPVVAMIPPVIIMLVMMVMPILIVLLALVAALRGRGRNGSQSDHHQSTGK
jgi:hypothetical protein